MRKCENCNKVRFERDLKKETCENTKQSFYLCVDQEACDERALEIIKSSPDKILNFLCETLELEEDEVLNEALTVYLDIILESVEEARQEVINKCDD